MSTELPPIDESLVRQLVAEQFPQWSELDVRMVSSSGWDNRTFHLGESLLVRMPSDEGYSAQVEKEQRWLPYLAARLPFTIPSPVAMGRPALGYPWHWSVYKWIDGETALPERIQSLQEFAEDLARFLRALQGIDSTDGPLAGPHSFHRGGSLRQYDDQTQKAITALASKIDVSTIEEIWSVALRSTWDRPPVWVHGDVSVGNLLIANGRLIGVIDFGQLSIGDPACDLAPAWTLFDRESRRVFREVMALDRDTWARGRAWVMWKALIIAAEFSKSNAYADLRPWKVIDAVLEDYRDEV